MSWGWGFEFGFGFGFGFEIVILVPRFCYVVIIRIAWTNEESNSVSRDARMRKHIAQLHLLFHIHWILKSTDLKTLND